MPGRSTVAVKVTVAPAADGEPDEASVVVVRRWNAASAGVRCTAEVADGDAQRDEDGDDDGERAAKNRASR